MLRSSPRSDRLAAATSARVESRSHSLATRLTLARCASGTRLAMSRSARQHAESAPRPVLLSDASPGAGADTTCGSSGAPCSPPRPEAASIRTGVELAASLLSRTWESLALATSTACERGPQPSAKSEKMVSLFKERIRPSRQSIRTLDRCSKRNADPAGTLRSNRSHRPLRRTGNRRCRRCWNPARDLRMSGSYTRRWRCSCRKTCRSCWRTPAQACTESPNHNRRRPRHTDTLRCRRRCSPASDPCS
jgi:hypothetical protein